MHDVDGVNAGYARLLLDDYLDNPESVSPEWRALFESGDSALLRSLPGVARLLERLAERSVDGSGADGRSTNGHGDGRTALAEPPHVAPPAVGVDRELLGAVAAAMALVKAHRMHGHLAAGL